MKPRILIVDDEPLNLTTMEAFLADEGYELSFAENGIDACAKAEIEAPDLILLDVMMPEMDGFEVTRRIRADARIGRVPIILVTALDDVGSRLEGLRAGADDFLTKPCRREEIRARVRTVASLNRFRSIAEQRERFERLFELSPDAILLVDAGDAVIAANERAKQTWSSGPTLDDSAGQEAVEIRSAIREARAGYPCKPREVRVQTAAGEKIFRVRGTTVLDGGKKLVMLVFDDVTAEVAARDELMRLNRDLEDIVRARTRQLEGANALLMSYANFVSHDLRSPLTVMKGYLSLLQEGVVPLNEEAKPMVGHAYGATVIMQELIENILQLAQDEHDGDAALSDRSVDPTPVLQRLVMRLRDLFPRPKPHFEIGALPVVGVSAVVVERIFYNLIANALKYSAQRPEPRIAIGGMYRAEKPVLFVRDNGVGFDARQVDRLFQEFSRLESAKGSDGLGLGLSLVARLVRSQGGEIWAESQIGQGATFYVQFPCPKRAGVLAGAPSIAKTLP